MKMIMKFNEKILHHSNNSHYNNYNKLFKFSCKYFDIYLPRIIKIKNKSLLDYINNNKSDDKLNIDEFKIEYLRNFDDLTFLDTAFIINVFFYNKIFHFDMVDGFFRKFEEFLRKSLDFYLVNLDKIDNNFNQKVDNNNISDKLKFKEMLKINLNQFIKISANIKRNDMILNNLKNTMNIIKECFELFNLNLDFNELKAFYLDLLRIENSLMVYKVGTSIKDQKMLFFYIFVESSLLEKYQKEIMNRDSKLNIFLDFSDLYFFFHNAKYLSFILTNYLINSVILNIKYDQNNDQNTNQINDNDNDISVEEYLIDPNKYNLDKGYLTLIFYLLESDLLYNILHLNIIHKHIKYSQICHHLNSFYFGLFEEQENYFNENKTLIQKSFENFNSNSNLPYQETDDNLFINSLCKDVGYLKSFLYLNCKNDEFKQNLKNMLSQIKNFVDNIINNISLLNDDNFYESSYNSNVNNIKSKKAILKNNLISLFYISNYYISELEMVDNNSFIKNNSNISNNDINVYNLFQVILKKLSSLKFIMNDIMSHTTKSIFQEAVENSFKKRGFNIITDTYVHNISVDILIPEKNHIIKVNGIKHYFRGSKYISLSEYIKDKTLINYKYKVSFITYSSYSGAKNKEEFLNNFINELNEVNLLKI